MPHIGIPDSILDPCTQEKNLKNFQDAVNGALKAFVINDATRKAFSLLGELSPTGRGRLLRLDLGETRRSVLINSDYLDPLKNSFPDQSAMNLCIVALLANSDFSVDAIKNMIPLTKQAQAWPESAVKHHELAENIYNGRPKIREKAPSPVPPITIMVARGIGQREVEETRLYDQPHNDHPITSYTSVDKAQKTNSCKFRFKLKEGKSNTTRIINFHLIPAIRGAQLLAKVNNDTGGKGFYLKDIAAAIPGEFEHAEQGGQRITIGGNRAFTSMVDASGIPYGEDRRSPQPELSYATPSKRHFPGSISSTQYTPTTLAHELTSMSMSVSHDDFPTQRKTAVDPPEQAGAPEVSHQQAVGPSLNPESMGQESGYRPEHSRSARRHPGPRPTATDSEYLEVWFTDLLIFTMNTRNHDRNYHQNSEYRHARTTIHNILTSMDPADQRLVKYREDTDSSATPAMQTFWKQCKRSAKGKLATSMRSSGIGTMPSEPEPYLPQEAGGQDALPDESLNVEDPQHVVTGSSEGRGISSATNFNGQRGSYRQPQPAHSEGPPGTTERGSYRPGSGQHANPVREKTPPQR